MQREKEEQEAAARERSAAAEARAARAADLGAGLSPEPAVGPGVASCLIRCGDGSRLARRFAADATPLQALFDFAEAAAAAVLPERYCLVLQYPRTRLTLEQAAAGATLAGAGVAPGQNVFFVEPM